MDEKNKHPVFRNCFYRSFVFSTIVSWINVRFVRGWGAYCRIFIYELASEETSFINILSKNSFMMAIVEVLRVTKPRLYWMARDQLQEGATSKHIRRIDFGYAWTLPSECSHFRWMEALLRESGMTGFRNYNGRSGNSCSQHV